MSALVAYEQIRQAAVDCILHWQMMKQGVDISINVVLMLELEFCSHDNLVGLLLEVCVCHFC